MQIQIQHNQSGQSGQAYDVRGVVVGTYAKVGGAWHVSWDGTIATIARTQKGAIQTLEYIASMKETPMTADTITCDACQSEARDGMTREPQHHTCGIDTDNVICPSCGTNVSVSEPGCDVCAMKPASILVTDPHPFLEVDMTIIKRALTTAAAALLLALPLHADAREDTTQGFLTAPANCELYLAFEDHSSIAYCASTGQYLGFDPGSPTGEGNGWRMTPYLLTSAR